MFEPVKSQVKLKAVCPRCSKPIRNLRAGSLTSWVFRSSTCSCVQSVEQASDEQVEIVEQLPDLGERYELVEIIGKGGMGHVYSVFDKETSTVRAAKVLHEELKDDSELVKRFLQEVEVLRNLDHPNLTAIYDHGFASNGTPFLVMDLVESKSLADVLADGGIFDKESILQIISEVCDALSYIHKKGVIHRDLKPSNILLEELQDGSVKPRLVDFGIAKLNTTSSREAVDLTQTGDVFGTPTYMSPEQCMGFKLDERSDIYSLGCVLFEMITGEPPFQAPNSMQMVIKHINETAPPLRSRFRKSVQDSFNGVIARCLAKEADQRYQSIEELSADLEVLKRGKSPRITIPKRVFRQSHSTTEVVFFCASIFSLFIYLVVLGSPNPFVLIILPALAVAAPVWLVQLVRFRKKFGIGKTIKESATLILYGCLSLFGLSALPVLAILSGAFESLPPGLQQYLLIPFFMHLFCACAVLAGFMNLLISNDDKNRCMTHAARRFSVILVSVAMPTIVLSQGMMLSYGGLSEIGLRNLAHAFVEGSLKRAALPETYEELARIEEPVDPNAAIVSLTHSLEASGYKDGDMSRAYPRMILRKRSQILNKIGKREQAINDISMLVAKFDSDHNADHWVYDMRHRRQRAGYYLDNGDYDLAIGDYSRSIDVSPGLESIPAFEGRAAAYYRKGDFDSAMKDLDTIVSFSGVSNVDRARAHIMKGLMLESQGQEAKAESEYRSASKLLADFDKSFGYLPLYASWLASRNPDALSAKSEPFLLRSFAEAKTGDKKVSSLDLVQARSLGLEKNDLLPDFLSKTGITAEW